MNVLALTALIEARRFLNDGWTQGTFARDARGVMCEWKSQNAKSFCSIGAVYKATKGDLVLCGEVLEKASAKLPYDFIYNDTWARFNDARGRKKQEVLNVFDKAIAAELKGVMESKELELV